MNFTNVHLDFHTSGLIENVGSEFSTEDFGKTLTDAEIDSITCFAKCHHGYLYYETDLPEKHPHLVKPLLNLQYQITKKAGIEMPAYISVGFDELQARLHPEWIAITESGNFLKEFGNMPFDSGWYWLCLNNNYSEKISEVIDDVIKNVGAVSGFFFDIVTQPPCCCANCRQSMLEENLKPHDLVDRVTFARKVERKFKDKVFKQIKSQLPDASVFFNGLVWNKITDDLDFMNYTQLEIESLPSGIWGYEHYPLVIKALRNQSLPTVAMTARFHKSWADFGGYKNIEALEYESIRGAILSGRVSIGDQLHPTGHIDKKAYENIGHVFKKTKPFMTLFSELQTHSEIAIIADNHNGNSDTFSQAVSGAALILQKHQWNYDIVEKQHFILKNLTKYQLLIFPDTINLTKADEVILQEYLAYGGKILFSHKSGINSENKPSDILPIESCEINEYDQDYFEYETTKYIAYRSAILATPKVETNLNLPIWYPYFNRSYQHFSSHFQTPYDVQSEYFGSISTKNVTYLAHPLFSLYKENGNKIYEIIINEVIENLITPIFNFVKSHSLLQTETFTNGNGVYYLACFYYPQQRVNTATIIDSIESLHNVEILIDKKYSIKHIEKLTKQTSSDICIENNTLHISEIKGYEIIKIELK